MNVRWLIPVVLAAIVSCSDTGPRTEYVAKPGETPANHSPSYEDLEMAMGQTIYVPVYSHVYQNKKKRPFNLVATLSIRNTDLERPIRLTSVRYYSSQGRLIRSYVDAPVAIGPLASTDFAVDEHDDTGSGTNFIVEWIAEAEVHEPLVEAVMISTELSQGLSFTCPGRVIRTFGAPAEP